MGVDGGGSKTFAVIVDEYGHEMGKGVSSSIDILNESEEEFQEHLFSAVDNALKEANLKIKDLSFACFGVPAVGDVEGIEDEVSPFIENLKIRNFIIVNDVRVALEGAFPFGKGAILLAGTGAMVMAKDERDRILRIDGWGEHVGDLGSGYFIGQLALREAFEEYDGRAKRTPFLEKIRKYANVSDLREVLVHCKGANVRKYIASFSKIVCEAEKESVGPAKKILDQAVDELVKSVKALPNVMSIEFYIPLSPVGGVFNCNYVIKEFKRRMSNFSKVNLLEKEFEPHIGAAIMAAKKRLNKEELLKLYQGLGGKQSENRDRKV